MLASLVLAWLSVACFPAAAQVGMVNFNNNFTPPGMSGKAFLIDKNGMPLTKGLWNLELLDSSGALIRSGTIAVDGLFFLGVVEIPGTTPGGSAEVVLRGWDISSGASYDTAMDRFSIVIHLFSLGGGALPPSMLASGSNFTGGPHCLCGPWEGPEVGIERIWATEDGVWVRGFSRPGSGPWVLEASSDLSHWAPVPNNAESHPADGWVVPVPDTPPTFFRIVLKSP